MSAEYETHRQLFRGQFTCLLCRNLTKAGSCRFRVHGCKNASLPPNHEFTDEIPDSSPLPEIPKTHWLVRRIETFRKPGDIGLGDTVARIFAKFGGDQFKWVFKTLGINCGCEDRQAALNSWFPYAK